MSLKGLGLKPWSCAYGERGDCETCREYRSCHLDIKKLRGMEEKNIPADCPRTGCLNCPRPFDGTCKFFSGD